MRRILYAFFFNLIFFVLAINGYSRVTPRIAGVMENFPGIMTNSLKGFSIGPSNKNVEIWDVMQGRLLQVIKTGDTWGLDINSKADLLITGGKGNVSLWRLPSGKKIRTISFEQDLNKKNTPGDMDLVMVTKDFPLVNHLVHIEKHKLVCFTSSNLNHLFIWDYDKETLKTIPNAHKNITSLDYVKHKDILCSASIDGLKIWDLKTWKLLSQINLKKDKNRFETSLALINDGKFVAVYPKYYGDRPPYKWIDIYHTQKGKLVKKLRLQTDHQLSGIKATTDGKQLIAYLHQGASTAIFWDGSSLKEISRVNLGNINDIIFDPVRKIIFKRSYSGQSAVFDFKTKKLLKDFSTKPKVLKKALWTPDGKRIILGSGSLFSIKKGVLLNALAGGFDDGCVSTDGKRVFISSGEILNTRTGKKVGNLFSAFSHAQIDTKGKFFVGNTKGGLRIYQAKNGRLLKKFNFESNPFILSPSGKFFISGSSFSRSDLPLKMHNLTTGTVAAQLTQNGAVPLAITSDSKYVLYHNKSYQSDRKNHDCIKKIDIAKKKILFSVKETELLIKSLHVIDKNKKIIYGTKTGEIVIRSMKNGNLIRRIKAHASKILSITPCPNNKYLVSTSNNGENKIWDLKTLSNLTTFYEFDDAFIAVSSHGYFEGIGNFQEYIYFTDENLNSYTFDQFAMKFYRPGILSNVLMGEDLPDEASLSEVIANKPAPVVRIVSPDDEQLTNSAGVEINASFTNRGGGIGKIHFYANGALIKTITDATAKKEKTSSKKIRVHLKQGRNKIKVVAFNREGTMSSSSDPITVTADYKFDKPSLYVFAIGIDQYNNAELNLNYAVADTKLFTNTIAASAAPLFKEIKSNLRITKNETTKSAIIEALKKFTEGINANDYFILYNSSHGDILTLAGGERKFFIIPSNVAFLDNENLKKDAISQDELITLFGNVPAQNKMLILDTCHSGKAGKAVQLALLEDNTVRTRSLSRKTAMELLRMASGSTVFTASQSVEAAFEGYQGHGLFTFTLAEGLRGAADSDNDKFVTISELKGFVELNVFNRSKRHFNTQQIPYINIGTIDLPIGQVN